MSLQDHHRHYGDSKMPPPSQQEIISEDERLARQLQMEEDAKQQSSSSPSAAASRYPPGGGREDALARQISDLNVKPKAKPYPPSRSAAPSFAREPLRISLKAPPPAAASMTPLEDSYRGGFAAAVAAGPPLQHQRARSVGDPRQLAGDSSGYFNNDDSISRSFDDSSSGMMMHRRSFDEYLAGGGGAGGASLRVFDDAIKASSSKAAAAASLPSSPRKPAVDDRLEYARKLQEEAFFNLHRTKSEIARDKASKEEADREFAMRMQREEDERSASVARQMVSSASKRSSNNNNKGRGSGGGLGAALEKDKALAMFMAESGTSFSELSTDFLNDLIGSADPNENRSSGPAPPPSSAPLPSSASSASRPSYEGQSHYNPHEDAGRRHHAGSVPEPVHIPPDSGMYHQGSVSSPRRAQQRAMQNGEHTGRTSNRPQEYSGFHPPSPERRSRRSPPAPENRLSMQNVERSARTGRPPQQEYGGFHPASPERRSREAPPVPDHSRQQTGGLRLPQSQQPNLPSSPGSNTVESAPADAVVSPGSQDQDKKSKKKGNKRRGLLNTFRRGGSGSSDDADPSTMRHIPGDIPPPPVGVPGAIPDAPPPPPPSVRRPPPQPPHGAMGTTNQQPYVASVTEVVPGRRASCGFPVRREPPLNGASAAYSSPRRASTSHDGGHMRGNMPHQQQYPRAQSLGGGGGGGGPSICAVCHRTSGPFLAALDKKYHPDCFRCAACQTQIDPYGQFKVHEDSRGNKTPYHPRCYTQAFGITCTVCRNRIPASRDGTVAYVKHPFFEKEMMCRRHADRPGRVCAACRRFEPVDRPFVNLGDSNRCVCPSCFRSVVVDNRDVPPLWNKVLSFFEYHLKLPLSSTLRDAPIILVDQDTLREQLARGGGHPHYGSNQILCSGVCLTDHECHGRRFQLPVMRYEDTSGSFEVVDDRSYYEIPRIESSRSEIHLSAILCLSGLPRELTATILAHEATHAWIKLHPKRRKALPPDVEEGCAQLVAWLFLNNGLGPPPRPSSRAGGPTDEQLRQYYKFCIERDNTDMFGTSYRRAAKAYRDIGIEALLTHVVHYGDFPHT